MAGNVLLDTNVMVQVLEERRPLLRDSESAEQPFVSTTIAGELYHGVENSARVAENLARLERLLKFVVILNCDTETAKIYGKVKTALRKKGRPIPDNDIWIAASALQHGLTLLTYDAHFSEVEGLTVQTP